ncbi:MAG: c-type cytochrome [Vicinamibacterales bacterium]
MFSRTIGGVLIILWAAGVAAQHERSVKEGVYTETQSKRGRMVYLEFCANCHGDFAEGIDMSPGLTGPTFSSNWTTFTVGDLYDRIRMTMPSDRPGVLTPQQNADVIAYILDINQYPAAQTELPSTVAPLKMIRIEAAQ